MNAIVCNKCNKVMTKDLRSVLFIKCSTANLGEIDTIHLCGNCKIDFFTFIDGNSKKDMDGTALPIMEERKRHKKSKN